MPQVFTWPSRAEEPDDELVDVWMHPVDGPQHFDADAATAYGPQCDECGSWDPRSDPEEIPPDPYRVEPDAVVCAFCDHRYPRGLARADETTF